MTAARARSKPKRTQEERREHTIGSLLDATISTLAELGYSQLTTQAVCSAAGVSQGGLFRHFPNRNALIAAATATVCDRHLALVQSGLARLQPGAPLESIVGTLRDAARSPEHAAWHEVMVAARTDVELRPLVAPTLQRFESDLIDSVMQLEGATPRLGTVLLSIMHMLDSEAVTVAVYPSPELEADRLRWLAELLQRELPL